jgi:hypothetical protein
MNSEQNDKVREAFEKWAAHEANPPRGWDIERDADGFYVCENVECAWQAVSALASKHAADVHSYNASAPFLQSHEAAQARIAELNALLLTMKTIGYAVCDAQIGTIFCIDADSAHKVQENLNTKWRPEIRQVSMQAESGRRWCSNLLPVPELEAKPADTNLRAFAETMLLAAENYDVLDANEVRSRALLALGLPLDTPRYKPAAMAKKAGE